MPLESGAKKSQFRNYFSNTKSNKISIISKYYMIRGDLSVLLEIESVSKPATAVYFRQAH